MSVRLGQVGVVGLIDELPHEFSHVLIELRQRLLGVPAYVEPPLADFEDHTTIFGEAPVGEALHLKLL